MLFLDKEARKSSTTRVLSGSVTRLRSTNEANDTKIQCGRDIF